MNYPCRLNLQWRVVHQELMDLQRRLDLLETVLDKNHGTQYETHCTQLDSRLSDVCAANWKMFDMINGNDE